MTNTQLLLSIGIPSLLVVLSWLSNDKRFSNLEARMDRLDARMDRLEARMDRLEARMDARFDALTSQIISLHERVAVVEARQG